ncbi:MAG: uroporphyrinogen-III C-methyltransferase [Halomonas sp.]|uniref:uroporphyrinogen-III C-methyltransferase n=1 Tax=Halomonas sp. TaxID=1486246 RepID=UPI003F909342
MNKQYNDQDDKQASSEAAQSGTPPASGTQAGSGANTKKGGASGRRSRRYNKPDNAPQRDEQSTGKSVSAGSATAADAASDSDKTSKTASAKPADSKTVKPESASDKGPADRSRSDKGNNKTSSSAGSGSAGGSGGGRAPASTASSGGSSGGKTGAVALVLTLVLGAAGGYFGWQLKQKVEAQGKAVSALPETPVSQAALDSLKSELKSGEQQRDQAVQSSLETLRTEFGDYRTSVNSTLDKVLTQLSQEQETDEREWLHADAAYLLRLANQRLQLERDVGGAAALLQTADKRLEEADNPALTPVRREIASELAELKSVPRVDSTGLYLELNALQERVSSLPLNQDIEEIVADAKIEEAPTGGWQSQLSTFGNELKGLVTVRKHDAALEALISPEQESYLRQSLRLVLEQSQLALLKQEQELYDASLDKALTLIRGYYDMDNAGVKAVVENIEQLRGEQIHPELPDISGSQQALSRFIQQRFEAGSRQGDNA